MLDIYMLNNWKEANERCANNKYMIMNIISGQNKVYNSLMFNLNPKYLQNIFIKFNNDDKI